MIWPTVWNSFSDFIAMGGRGAFVWGAYGVTLLLIVLELVLLARSRKQALRELWRRQQIHTSTDTFARDDRPDLTS